ncbi:hypothetical protein PBY51_022433 [Eleginops maclovinus]|nr:hypothetical protein PBY51_022433 [Eleginops maclovinus]
MLNPWRIHVAAFYNPPLPNPQTPEGTLCPCHFLFISLSTGCPLGFFFYGPMTQQPPLPLSAQHPTDTLRA